MKVDSAGRALENRQPSGMASRTHSSTNPNFCLRKHRTCTSCCRKFTKTVPNYTGDNIRRKHHRFAFLHGQMLSNGFSKQASLTKSNAWMQLLGGRNTSSSTVSTMLLNSNVILNPASEKGRSRLKVSKHTQALVWVSIYWMTVKLHAHIYSFLRTSWISLHGRTNERTKPRRETFTFKGFLNKVTNIPAGAKLSVWNVDFVLIPHLYVQTPFPRSDVETVQQCVFI